jgi:LCP family protein required for cell wall assembly
MKQFTFVNEGLNKTKKFVRAFSRKNEPQLPLFTAPKKSRSLWLKISLFVLFIVLTSLASIGVAAYWYLSQFERESGFSVASIYDSVKAGWQHDILSNQGDLTLLVIGIDEIEKERSGSLLTDTIMLARITPSGRTHLLSLPRDLWINSLKTKINALYYYGEISDSTTGIELLASVIEEVTGVEIHHHLILNMTTVRDLVDAIGGVEIAVERGFVDSKYPRAVVEPTSTDPEDIYETVEFRAGSQIMDGETALKFIRSRQSEDLSEGTDLARAARQQLVIQGMIRKMTDLTLLTDPATVGKVYRLYRTTLSTSMNDEVLVSLAKNLARKDISFTSHQIPVAEYGSEGVIFNPPVSKYKQWVYEPVDTSWAGMKKWIQTEMDDTGISYAP